MYAKNDATRSKWLAVLPSAGDTAYPIGRRAGLIRWELSPEDRSTASFRNVVASFSLYWTQIKSKERAIQNVTHHLWNRLKLQTLSTT